MIEGFHFQWHVMQWHSQNFFTHSRPLLLVPDYCNYCTFLLLLNATYDIDMVILSVCMSSATCWHCVITAKLIIEILRHRISHVGLGA